MPNPNRRSILLFDGATDRPDRSAGFDGSSKLQVTNDGTFTPANNEDWHVVFWVNFDDTGGTALLNAGGPRGVAATDTWFCFYNGTDLFGGGYSNGSSFPITGITHTAVTDTWYMFSFGIDNDASPLILAELWNESGKVASASNGGSGFVNTSQNNPLRLGDLDGTDALIGRMDKVGIYNRLLVDADHTALYNGGAGLRYDQLPESLLTGLVEWYDLDDKSGSSIWRASHAGHHLTATGLVTSQPPVSS